MLHTYEPVHVKATKIMCASSKVYIDRPSYSCPCNISAASGWISTQFKWKLSVSRVEGHNLSMLWNDVLSWNYGPLTKLVLIYPVNLVHAYSQQILVEFQQNFRGTFSIKNRRAYPNHVMVRWFSLSSGMRKFRIDQDFLIQHWHMIYIMPVVFAEIHFWMKLNSILDIN